MSEAGYAEVIIRPARLADLPAILTLWRQLQDINAAVDPRLTLSAAAPDWMADFLRDQMDNENAALLVAVSDAEAPVVVGYTLGQICAVRPWTTATAATSRMCASAKVSGVRASGGSCSSASGRGSSGRGLTAIEVQVVRANPASQAFWRKMGCGEFLRTLRTEIG